LEEEKGRRVEEEKGRTLEERFQRGRGGRRDSTKVSFQPDRHRTDRWTVKCRQVTADI
jgi:hypothetical protein